MLSDHCHRILALLVITVSARLVQRLAWLLFNCALVGANYARSDEAIRFEAVWEGDFVAVSAAADLQVEAATAWSTLTDYERFAEFIPDMVSSRIVARNPGGMTVEYRGQFGFLFFRQPMHLVLEVVFDPPRRILARSVAGDLRDMTSIYEISEMPQGLRLAFTARFLPAVSLPPFIGLAIVRHQMEKQFAAMITEIIRRGALSTEKNRGELQR